jgi:spermidine synthase
MIPLFYEMSFTKQPIRKNPISITMKFHNSIEERLRHCLNLSHTDFRPLRATSQRFYTKVTFLLTIRVGECISAQRPSNTRRSNGVVWYFIFFFISGFCSVLYELVWLRLSMAEFGVTTAMVSIVLSVFMGGLGLGSWASGKWIRQHGEKINFPVLRLYAVIELLIGVSGILVPYELGVGHSILERFGSSSSLEFYILSGIWVTVSLMPWCALMGATIPVAMLAIRGAYPRESSRSFSYLYMANVAGALCGAVVPLFLIELAGFHRTLKIAAVCNCFIALLAMISSKTMPSQAIGEAPQIAGNLTPTATRKNWLLALLFATGLTSMGIEVVWVREFTPFVGTMVYAFATILGVYLLATFIGSCTYRGWGRSHTTESPLLWTLLPLCALLPLFAANPEFDLYWVLRLSLGIAPFAGLLGFLTPMLVDRWSGGNPAQAGKAYAVNVLGCILGPLLAGFLLLPWISERWALLLLILPWVAVGLGPAVAFHRSQSWMNRVASYALLPAVLVIFLGSKGYEQQYATDGRIMRDSTATVIATGSGMGKHLLVNGYGMTVLTPVTKMMAHLPLAFLDHPPQNVLVICFGMGTTFRSALSWGVPATVVELVPSVPRLFSYFHSDASEVLSSPLAHVVVDDGRRYLERTTEQYDVITIDPPPPVEAAGSSLLYSEDFYTVARQHLRAGGILQQWLDTADAQDLTAVARALSQSFAYVRVFTYGPGHGFHFLASDQPLPRRMPGELASRLPASAARDLIEWGPDRNPQTLFSLLMWNEIPIKKLLTLSPKTPALSDDRPVNEYYLLRTSMPR